MKTHISNTLSRFDQIGVVDGGVVKILIQKIYKKVP